MMFSDFDIFRRGLLQEGEDVTVDLSGTYHDVRMPGVYGVLQTLSQTVHLA